MAKKKPSAAQVAARKLFAARAKAGAFGRKRNPASGKDHDIGFEEWDDSGEVNRNPVARSGHSRNANNLGRSGHSRNANSLARSRSGPYSSFIDLAHERAKPVKRNPSSPASRAPSCFYVHRIKATGERGLLIGAFPKKTDAVTFARDYADANKVQVGIVGKK